MADVTQRVDVVATSKGFDQLLKTLKLTDDAASQLTQELVKAGAISQKQGDQISRSFGKTAAAMQNAQKAGQAFGGQQQQVAQATQATNTATSQMAGNLPRLRYALYDVSTTLAFTGAAMTGLATATALVSVQMDRAFADVVRTTGTYLDSTGASTAALRSEFNELFSTLPKSWADITEIGTLAGQLDIATENVAEFTELVAKFASVTDVTVEASATAFGRLSQLLKVPAEQYENLGSSILAVGVSSVATESQIISISSQIASMGDFAGLSADEVIGFSSALASLGVQPELARGTITRLFTQIATSVDAGGEKLESFAGLAGTSADEFANAWRNDASGAIMQLLQGLERVDSAGGSAITSLRELGITSVRDVPTLLKLAQNYGLVAEQLDIASNGYSEGTALQEQYGVIAQTTAEKLTLLTNNIKLFISSLGETDGPLATVIDGVTSFIRGLTGLAESDFAQTVAGISLAITALGGVLLIAAGGAARFVASGLAMKTALIDMSVAAGTYKTATDAASVGTLRLATSIKAVRVALVSTGIGAAVVAIGTALAYFMGEADKASAASERLKEAVLTDSSSGEGLQVTAQRAVDYGRVLDGVSVTQEAWNRIFEGSSTYAEEYAQAIADANAEVENFKVTLGGDVQGELINLLQDSDAIRKAFENSLIPESLDFSVLTDTLIREGEAGAQAYIDSIFNPEQMQARMRELEDLTMDIDLIDSENFDANVTELDALRARMQAYNNITQEVVGTNNQLTGAIENARYEQRIQGDVTQQAGVAAETTATQNDDLTESVESVTDAVFGMINAQSGLNSSIYELGQSVYENGQNFDSFSASGRENLDALQNVFSATADIAAANGITFEEAMAVVGRAMVQSGVISVQQLEALGVAGINFGNELLTVAEATSQAVAALQNQMASLQSANNGLTRGQTADGLRYAGQAIQVIEQGGAGAATAMKSMGIEFNRLEGSGSNTAALLDQITQGWQDSGEEASKSGGKQSKAAKEAAREVRTLSDYVSDLESVLGDAFDFRFGFQEAKDDGADAFQAITDRIDDAKQSVRDLNQSIRETRATIQSLKSDRSILQYQLGIAIEYDDELRAAAIRAELGENSADLKDAENDLQDAQKDLSKQQDILTLSLTGNTEASRDNRDVVLSLIQAYQEQITAYANTGASQAEVQAYTDRLNEKFKAQLTQLGYNRREVDLYAAAFRDTKKILDQMPKNLTLKANTDPAQRAMDEFRASARDANKALSDLRNNAGKTISGPKFNDSATKKFSREVAYRAELARLEGLIGTYRAQGNQGAIAAISNQIKSLRDILNSGKYYDGGFTGRGGKYEAAGIVHRGEYVVPKEQVNQSTGLPYADAYGRLSQGTPAPSGYANGGHVQSSGLGTVRLDAMSIQMLARALPRELVANGQVIGAITAQSYAHSTRVGAN